MKSRHFFSRVWLVLSWGACSLWVNAQDATLDGLVEAALRTNPGMQAMQHRVRASDAAWRKARASYWPQLSGSVGYQVTDNAPQAFMMTLNQRQLDMTDPSFDFNDPGYTDNLNFGVKAGYVLFNPQRGVQRDASRVELAMAEARGDIARNALIHEVTRSYYRLLQAQAFVKVQESALDSIRESLRVSRARYETGQTVKTDVLNLEVQEAKAEEGLVRAENGVRLAIAALNTAVGASVIDEKGLPEPKVVMAFAEPDGFHEDLIAGRPEYRLTLLQQQAADLKVQGSRVAYAPQLQVFGQWNLDGEALDATESSYLAGVALDWDLFAGGARHAESRVSRAQRRAVEAHSAQVRNELLYDVRQAWLRIREAGARFSVAERSVGSAEEALRITRAQYEEGAVEVALLLVAETGLTESRIRYTAAYYDYRIAESDWDRATGALLNEYPQPVSVSP